MFEPFGRTDDSDEPSCRVVGESPLDTFQARAGTARCNHGETFVGLNMQLARVIGHAVSTVKHASMHGWRLLVVQPLGVDDKPDGEPLLAIDSSGSAVNDVVIVSNDGA